MLVMYEPESRTQEETAPHRSTYPGGNRRTPLVKNATGVPIVDAISSFLSNYLACDPHQLTVLTLWVIYTWCFEHFFTAAYLEIRSPEPQSGKTLCLELLEMLCDSPWMATGADPRTITSH